jgi:hypothetical protein
MQCNDLLMRSQYLFDAELLKPAPTDTVTHANHRASTTASQMRNLIEEADEEDGKLRWRSTHRFSFLRASLVTVSASAHACRRNVPAYQTSTTQNVAAMAPTRIASLGRPTRGNDIAWLRVKF